MTESDLDLLDSATGTSSGRRSLRNHAKAERSAAAVASTVSDPARVPGELPNHA